VTQPALFERDGVARAVAMLRTNARAAGVTEAVRIAGGAGLGKTALLQLIASAEPGRVARVSARASDAHRPLEGLARIARALPPQPDEIASAMPSWPEYARSAILDALQLRPGTTLVIDDAQWLDPASRDVLDEIFRTPSPSTVLIAERGDVYGTAHWDDITLHLAPLGRIAAARLARRIAPGLARDAAEEIILCASGIPSCIVLLAQAACGDAVDAPGDGALATLSARLAREPETAVTLARTAAAYDDPIPAGVLASAAGIDPARAAHDLSALSDVIAYDGEVVRFRHRSLSALVRRDDPAPVVTARRVYDAELRSGDRSIAGFRRLRDAARRCGEPQTFVSASTALGFRLARAHQYGEAADVFREAWETDPALEGAAARAYLDALRVLGRDEECVHAGRSMFHDALSRNDATTAVRIAGEVVHGLATLDRDVEAEAFLADALARPALATDPAARGYLRAIALSNAAFDGNLARYDELAAQGPLLPRDRRAEAYARALRGDAEGSAASIAAWRGTNESSVWDDNLEGHRLLLIGGPAACQTWWEMIGRERLERDLNGAGSARTWVFFLLASGRWSEARDVLDRVDPMAQRAEYRYPLLEVALMLDALRGVAPRRTRHALDEIRTAIGKGRTRSVWGSALWWAAGAVRSGGTVPADIANFIVRGAERWPRPSHLAAIPLAAFFARSQLRDGAFETICRAAPRPGSRWLHAQAALADALASGNPAALKAVRDDFDALAAPAFAMIAGAELPGPRFRDVSLAQICGYGRDPDPSPSSLSERERDVAELAAGGLRNRDIADRLFIAERTVETHLTAIYRKLGVRSRAGLASRLSS
jgi:DNA-binding CsgD family transcriptional regulator/tetratricopeptide (TPR) repeat protein